MTAVHLMLVAIQLSPVFLAAVMWNARKGERKAMHAQFRGQLDLYMLQSATERARQYADDTRRHVDAYATDQSREQRLAARQCPWCFYFRGSRLSGQAFTDWKCSGCGQDFSHPNTAVPMLCPDCSDKHQACTECCADLELRQRRSLTIKVARRPRQSDSDKARIAELEAEVHRLKNNDPRYAAVLKEREALTTRVSELEKERDRERLRYGRQFAANTVWMKLAAKLARNGQQELAQETMRKAGDAAAAVRLEDFVSVQPAATPEKQRCRCEGCSHDALENGLCARCADCPQSD